MLNTLQREEVGRFERLRFGGEEGAFGEEDGGSEEQGWERKGSEGRGGTDFARCVSRGAGLTLRGDLQGTRNPGGWVAQEKIRRRRGYTRENA